MHRLLKIYNILNEHYGPQHWWPGETPFEVMVGAVLTQNTSWSNVERAIENLRPYLEPHVMMQMENHRLAALIKPSGYYNIKAQRLKSLLAWFEGYGYDPDRVKEKDAAALRGELLAVKGIGRETADSILLYALDKPVFVVDAYTRRLMDRLGFHLAEGYDGIREYFERCLPRDLYIYNQYHALIVRHCKVFCKSRPQCEGCVLLGECRKAHKAKCRIKRTAG